MVPESNPRNGADGRPAPPLRAPAPPARLHVVGVGGAGMSALAIALAGMGYAVSGSDLKAANTLERVRAAGVTVGLGHDPAWTAGVDALVVSSAIPPDNVEVRAAEAAGIPVVPRATALAWVVAARRSVAVAGTHGKTTTTSMLAQILSEAGLRPSFVVGGELNETGANAAWDEGEWLVVEADESDGTFLVLPAEVAVVTNVEPDHLDHYGSEAALEEAFGRFLGAARLAVVGADDPVAARLGREVGAVDVGRDDATAYRIVAERRGPRGASFHLIHEGDDLGRVGLAIPGAHNVANAALAAAVADQLGVPFAATEAALARFAGVSRRFQLRGQVGGVTVVEDYAHLPSEVRAAIATAREVTEGRVVVVFQPHRYSRIAALGPDFAPALAGADLIVVTEVYPAGEAPRPGVSGRFIAEATAELAGRDAVRFVASTAELRPSLAALAEPGDLLLVLGAGDITGFVDEILEELAEP